MMVIYHPVKFGLDWTNRFRVRVRKRKCGRIDGWTDKQTNEQTELHQFRKEPSYGTKNVDGRRTHQSNRRVGYTQPA